MTDSITVPALLDHLSSCISNDFAPKSLALLCEALDVASKSVDGARIELVYALANFAHQLRDGAVEATEETSQLFTEAKELLGQHQTLEPRHARVFENRIAHLLDCIDIEASGGFDEDEAGEFTVDGPNPDPSLRRQVIRNALTRLRATVETLQRNVPSGQSVHDLLAVTNRQSTLLDGLEFELRTNQAVPRTALAEIIGIEFSGTQLTPTIADNVTLHPSMLDLMTSLTRQLGASVGIGKVGELTFENRGDNFSIQLYLEDLEFNSSDLRLAAVNHGFLQEHTPLRDEDLLQFALLPPTARDAPPIRDISPLLSLLHAVCADVAIETHDGNTRMVLSIASNARLENVTVFSVDGELYGILTEGIAVIKPVPKFNAESVEPTVEHDGHAFRVVTIGSSTRRDGPCILLNETQNHVALMMDDLEPQGQVIRFDDDDAKSLLGGSTQLLDGRIVVIVSSRDEYELERYVALSTVTLLQRLLVLGEPIFAKSLNKRHVQVVSVSSEFAAMREIQEHQPHAILMEMRQVAEYAKLLSFASAKRIAVLTHASAEETALAMPINSQVKVMKTPSELNAALQALTHRGGTVAQATGEVKQTEAQSVQKPTQ